MISNGYNQQAVLNALFGRLKWRSLNLSGAQPVNSTIEVPRENLILTVGKSNGLTIGGTVYTDSSLTGWTYVVLNPDATVVAVTFQAAGFTLSSGVFTAGQQLFLTFKPQQVISQSRFSGSYFENTHPFCTLLNLGSVIEQQNTVGGSGLPTSSFLTDLESGVIMTLINGIFNESQLIEDTMLYDRKLRQDNAWTNNGKFCGFRLYISPGQHSAAIRKASFIFNGAATFNLYLYQDMNPTPLFTQQVTTVAGQEVYVDLTDWIIKYHNGNSAQNGVYYIGYYQNDLGSVQALDQFVSQWNKTYAFGYTAFETPQTGVGTFNRIAIPYSFVTYGMNLVVESYRDYTHKIIQNASLFDKAIGLTMAVVVLGFQAYNTRTNINQRLIQDIATVIYGELNNSGDAKDINPYVAGLKMELKRELKRINDNFFKKPGVMTARPPIFEGSNLQGVFP